MQIYIFGDLEFAYFILNGVTMLFSGDASFIRAALILSLLFLMWSFIKWSMNPDKTPYPVREFGMGLIFFLIFGGTSISPKVQVTLISANNSAARIVTDVPLLAAAPSWLATNLFKTMTDRLETGGFFVIPGYENLRNYGIPAENQSDPLTALVQLYKLANTRVLSRHAELNIKNYLLRCYDIDRSPAFKNISHDYHDTDLLSNFFSKFEVTNPNLTMDYIDKAGDPPISITCAQGYTNLSAAIHVTSAPIDDSTFAGEAFIAATTNDISTTGLRMALKTINDSLTGTSTSPDPFTFGSNLFFATKVKDHLANGGSTMSLWADKMIYEAERKRTAEAVGNRSLFLKIYIPTITAIECFSFFIAPVLMILSILGGYGFSLIGKYLMLVLFINLWSFIKVFVDVVTALSISKAFKHVTAATEKQHPFTFQNYATSIMEVESLLTVAANLTVAIPFFAMFLLYGGVHSVMGVMRTVTGGSVDGNNMAPTMSTTMNNGARQMGDANQNFNTSGGYSYQTHTEGTTRGTSNISFNQTHSQLTASGNQAIETHAKTSTDQLAQSIQKTQSFSDQWTALNSGTASQDFSTMNAQQRIATVAHAIKGDSTMSQADAVDHALSLAVDGGGSVRFGANAVSLFSGGVSLGIKAGLQASGRLSTGDQIAENKSKLNNWAESNSTTAQYGDGRQVASTNSTSNSGQTTEAYSEVNQSIEQLSLNRAINASFGKTRAEMGSFITSQSLSHSGGPEINDAYENSVKELNDKKGTNIDISETFRQHNGNGLNALQAITTGLLKDAPNNFEGQKAAYENAGFLWNSVAERMQPGTENQGQVRDYARMFTETAKSFNATPETLRQNVDTGAIANPNVTPVTPADGEPFKTRFTNGQKEQRATIAGTAAQVEAGKQNVPGYTGPPKELTDETNAISGRMGQVREQFASQQALRQGALFAQQLSGYADKALDMIKGPSELWGKGGKDAANRTSTDLAQNGFYTDGFKKGYEQLATNGLANVANAFSGGKPSSAAFDMNDALIGLTAQYGKDWPAQIPQNEDGQRFLAAAGQFVSQKQQLSEPMRQAMDSISMSRLDGSLPQGAADVLIGNLGKGGDIQPLSTASNHTSPERAAMRLLQQNDDLKSNPGLAYAAGHSSIADGNLTSAIPNMKPQNAGAPENATSATARGWITDSEKGRIGQALEYRNDSEQGFVTGINRDVNDNRLVKGLDQYLKPNGNGTGLREALEDEHHQMHSTALAVANSGMGHLAQRLDDAGFTPEAKQFRERQTRDLNKWSDDGFITTPQNLRDLARIGVAALSGDDSIDIRSQQNISASPPIAISSQEKLTYQGGGESNGNYAASIDVDGYSSPVIVSGESRGLSFPAGAYRTTSVDEASQRIASQNFAFQASTAATIYSNIRSGFYAESNINEGNPPESFRSKAGQTFERSDSSDGVYTYSSPSDPLLGSYTWDTNRGNGEFRPTEDNPLFNRQDTATNKR